MPEGPELHMAASFINEVAARYRFGGPVIKSEVSTKNPDVLFSSSSYTVSAQTRGKEMKMFLKSEDGTSSTHILFRFGMSGCFRLSGAEELPKHAHLQFYTTDQPRMALSFVDYRRFGRWEVEGPWGADRGPDPCYQEHQFRGNVLDSLDSKDFNRPICEVLLNQKYFNGIGNYLRAEILHRAGVAPFAPAREVLQGTKGQNILQLCTAVPLEVINLEKGKNYELETENSGSAFTRWLRCYAVEGMQSLQDANRRTVWFSGEAGPMKPRNSKPGTRKGPAAYRVPKSGNKGRNGGGDANEDIVEGETRKRGSKVVKTEHDESGEAKIKVEINEDIVMNESRMHDSKVVKKENYESKKANIKEIKMEIEDNIPKRRGRVARDPVDEDKNQKKTEARKAKVTKEKKVPLKKER